MLSMQSGAGCLPDLFSLLFLFATLVMLLVSRRHLSRWACCRRLPSPDEADPAVESLHAEAAGAEVEVDAGAEVEAEAEGTPLGLAVESAGAAGQPEAPAEARSFRRGGSGAGAPVTGIGGAATIGAPCGGCS